MRDRDHGPALHQIVELLLDRGLDLLRRSAEVASSSARMGAFFRTHAGDGDALALAAGELHPALAHMGVEAAPALPILQGLDELERMGLGGGGPHLLIRRGRPAVADVVGDGAVQQRGILGHHGDMGAQALLRRLGDVLAVDQDPPRLYLVEAQQDVDEGRLAGAGGADEAEALARRDVEIDAMQHAAGGAVAEAHILEAHGALLDLEGRRPRLVGHQPRHRDRAHAVLHHADVLEDGRHVLGHPARDIGDLPSERQGHGDDADGDLPAGPEPDGRYGGAHHHGGVQQGQGQAEQGDEPELAPEGHGMLVHRPHGHRKPLVPRPRAKGFTVRMLV